MRTLLFLTTFIFVCLAQIEGQLAPPVIGYVDGVRNASIIGWACQKYIPTSLEVHLYVGNAAGQPGATIVKAGKANLHSEVAIANECRTKEFRNNRFSIDLTADEILKHRNKRIFVRGIKLFGDVPNSLLADSGKFRIPVPVDTDPKKSSPSPSCSPQPREKRSQASVENRSPHPNIYITPKVTPTPNTMKQEGSVESVSDGLGTIIGSVIGGLCVIVGAVVGVWKWRRGN